MKTDADRIIAEILHADDEFLMAVGKLTLLFSSIEDILVDDARTLAGFTEDQALKDEADAPALLQLRVLDKRDFLKRVNVEIGRYHEVDSDRVNKVLDELGNINRLRRTVLHGWIRWSEDYKQPVLVDSHGQSQPALTNDLLGLNLKVLTWLHDYSTENLAFMEEAMSVYKIFLKKLEFHTKSPVHKKMLEKAIARMDEAGLPMRP